MQKIYLNALVRVNNSVARFEARLRKAKPLSNESSQYRLALLRLIRQRRWIKHKLFDSSKDYLVG